jgi:trans-aconitate methyltransferase
MRVHQKSNATSYNRYPDIFNEVTEHVSDNPMTQILSFGCSIGKECTSLSEIYFKQSKISGFDVHESIIRNNILSNTNPRITYFNDSSKLIEYDLVFVMSVLCNWPDENNIKGYSYDMFTEALNSIDSLIKIGGCCVYTTPNMLSRIPNYQRITKS